MRKVIETLGRRKNKLKKNAKLFIRTGLLILGFVVLSVFLMLIFALVIITLTDSAGFALIGLIFGMILSVVILAYAYPVVCKDFDKYWKEKPGGV